MSQEITNQFRFLLLSLCTGMIVMAGYDVVRFLRFLISHNKLWVWIEDLLYWCLVSFPVFLIFLQFQDGVIRWYGVIALISGALLYEYGISRVCRAWGNAFFLPKKQKLKRMLISTRKRLFCADFTKKMKKRKKH